MTDHEGRRLTPGTSPEDVRLAIVRAAIPLIGDRNALTTAQLASAAGIDEASLLRVFPDKDAVIQACIGFLQSSIAAALDPAEVVRELDSVPLDQPLAVRLVRVIEALDAYYLRIRTDVDSVIRPGGSGTVGDGQLRPLSRDDFRMVGRLDVIIQAVTRLLEPDQRHLRLPVGILAEAFLGMSLGAARTPLPDREPLPAAQLVDVFLHGVLTAADPTV